MNTDNSEVRPRPAMDVPITEDTLSDAIRELIRAGDINTAAHLLNEQALLYVQRGDSVRAACLLERERTMWDPIVNRKSRNSSHAETPMLNASACLHRDDELLETAGDPNHTEKGEFQQPDGMSISPDVWETILRFESRGRVFEPLGRLNAPT